MKNKLLFKSSWDDGHPLDIRIADLLQKYNLPGTFYIPGMVFEPLVLDLSKKGFEIGGHTVTHPSDLKQLSDEELLWEIVENKKALENETGQKINSFCYPRGRYDNRALDILKSLGFTHARTTEILALPYPENHSPTPDLKAKTSIHVYQRKEYGDLDWLSWAYNLVAQAVENDLVFHIWGHSWEIDRDKNWGKLELFFSWITENYEIIKQ